MLRTNVDSHIPVKIRNPEASKVLFLEPVGSRSAQTVAGFVAGIGHSVQTRSSHIRQSAHRSKSVVPSDESILHSSFARASCSISFRGLKRG